MRSWQSAGVGWANEQNEDALPLWGASSCKSETISLIVVGVGVVDSNG